MSSVSCQNISITSKPSSFQLEDLKLLPIPIICIFGMFSNIISVIILTNSKIRNYSTFKYMLATSISNFFYLLLIMPSTLENCSTYCSFILKTYWFNFLRLYLFIYLTSCLAIFSILVDIVLSLKYYQIITNKLYEDNVSPVKRIIFLLTIISILYYLPAVFLNSIENCQNNQREEQYEIANKDLNFSIEMILHTIRLILVFVILTVINILNCIKYNELTKNKILIKNNRIRAISVVPSTSNQIPSQPVDVKLVNITKKKKKLILMVIVKSGISFLGLIPLTIFMALRNAQNYDDGSILGLVLYSLLLISNSLNLFVYYWFNSLFKSVLKSYFKRLF
jgi:hypothetical protein